MKRPPCSWMPLVLRAALATSSAGTPSASAAPTRTPMLQVTNWLSGDLSTDLSTFAVQADGSLRGPLWLTPMPGSPDRPRNPLVAVPSPDGRTLYVSDWGSSELATFRISRSGRPRPLAAVPPAPPAPSNPAGLAVTPDGRRLFLAGFNGGAAGTISRYDLDPAGRARPVETVDAGGAGAAGLALSPNGRTLALAAMTTGAVATLAVADDGSLSHTGTVLTGAGAFFPAFSPDGRLLLVVNALANTLSTLRMRPGRTPVLVASVPTGGDGPRGIAITGDGHRAYIAHYAGGTGPGVVTTFALDPPRGTATAIGPPVPTGGNGAEAILLARSDRTLYVANFNTGGPGSVTTFTLRPDATPQPLGPPVPTGGRQPDFGGLALTECD
jgi:6-phosphogluconolactonase (cycloisomerase 2 family)